MDYSFSQVKSNHQDKKYAGTNRMRSLKIQFFLIIVGFLLAPACSAISEPVRVTAEIDLVSSPESNHEQNLKVISPTESEFQKVPTATILPTTKQNRPPLVVNVTTPTPPIFISQPLPELLTNVKIVAVNDLRKFTIGTGLGGVVFRTDDGFEIKAGDLRWREVEEYYPTSISKGEGIVISMEYDPLSRIKIYLQPVDSVENIRWGIVPNYFPKSYTQNGDIVTIGQYMNGNLILKPNQVHNLMIALDDSDTVRLVYWDPENPNLKTEIKENLGVIYPNQKWSLKIRVNRGQLVIYDLTRISFNGNN